MLLVICVALALSEAVWGRAGPSSQHHQGPSAQHHQGMEALSNLQMLIPLLLEDSQAEESRAAPAPAAAPRYSDGPYSDIPAEAFLIDSKAPDMHKSTVKKDLAQFRAVSSPSLSPPRAVVSGCVRYFQGRSPPAGARDAEALLQLCTEILDDAHVEDVQACACCPPPAAAAAPPSPRAHDEEDGEAEGGLGSLVRSLLQLFSGAGSRRRWLIMNSNHPDPQMRQYVDVEV